MNSDILADPRIPLDERVTFAAQFLRAGPKIPTLTVCLHSWETPTSTPGRASHAIVTKALALGWRPTGQHSGEIDPARWLKAVRASPWAPNFLRNLAHSALEGKLDPGDHKPVGPLLMIVGPDSKDDHGVGAALAKGWSPSAEQIKEALAFDPTLADKWPGLASLATG